ncbi:trypsin-like peptidase domain-containing protein [Zavarzinia sp.]|uniref:serine protease n=1 Tax=Zavarzinia sp. TaxID=2027920 RepID=UPI003BB780EA
MAKRLGSAVSAAIMVLALAVQGAMAGEKGSIRPGGARPAPEATTPSGPAGSVEGDSSNGLSEIAAANDPRILQLALIWAGYSTDIATGTLDDASRDAIKAFQRDTGVRATGTLTADQTLELLRIGAEARAKVGWTSYISQDLGFRIGYPAVQLTKTRPGEGGARTFTSADGSRLLDVEVIASMSASEYLTFFNTIRNLKDGGKRVTRAVNMGAYFVFEGMEGDQRFTGRVDRRENGAVGFTYYYPPADAPANEGLVAAIVSEFVVPDRLAPPEATPPDTVVGFYAKDEAREGSAASVPDVAGDEPAQPARPSRPDQPGKPGRPPSAAEASDQVPLPTLPMPVATQSLDPSGVFQKVKDAVWVVVAAPLRNGQPFLEDGFSQGSAVAVTAQHLFTNCHVLEGQQFFGIFRNEDMSDLRPVSIKLRDEEGDRCIIRVDKPDLPSFVTIRSHADVVIGERAYTIGAPSGLDLTLGEGLVSSKRRNEGQQYVQTSAPISPGSSGGGLFDARGNLLGITTFMLKDTQNLNFAIAAEEFLRPGPSAGSH